MSYDFESFWFSGSRKFSDECGHAESEYIGSFLIEDVKDKQIISNWHDLYVFQSGEKQNLCIRYGNVCNEYYSPGELSMFLTAMHQLPVYQKAYELLCRKGTFSYNKKS